MVHDSQYSIVSVLLRESCDEVHGDLLKGEGAFFGSDPVEWRSLLMGEYLVLLAGCAAFYIVCDPLSHPGPGQDLCGFSNCFVSSRVSCGGVIMDEGHEISFRGVWDLCCSSVDKEFWFEEGLVFVVVVSLIRIGWS